MQYQPVINTLVYTRFLIQERIGLLQSLDKRRKALPSSEYLSCRRSLLQGIEELKTVCCPGRNTRRFKLSQGVLSRMNQNTVR